MKNGTGNYTIYFTTPMPDSGYSFSIESKQDQAGSGGDPYPTGGNPSNPNDASDGLTTTSARFQFGYTDGSGFYFRDQETVSAVFIR